MHFTLAVLAAHRTRLYYTPTEQNCYWFANAILYILRMEYTPSEPPIADDVQGTWSFGPLHIPLGSLSNLDGKTLLTEYATCQMEESGMPVDMDLKWARWEQALDEDRAKMVQEHREEQARLKQELQQVRAAMEKEIRARVEKEIRARVEQEHRAAQAKLELELREEQAKRLEEQAKREAAEARAAALQAQLNAGRRSSTNAP